IAYGTTCALCTITWSVCGRTRTNADGTKRYYYDHGEVEGRRFLEPLGTDRVVALQRWTELEGKRAPSRRNDPAYVHDA
ncbi:hypothetical protein ACGYWN_16460, partial [Burkholderia pseudomallei]